MKASKELIQAIAVTVELTGTTLTPDAARVMADDLSRYPVHQVLGALTRCRREIRTRLTVADVVARLDDGRPGPEEAWAMIPRDELKSVVWTDEMASAFGIALPLLLEGEEVPARMAFLEAYRKKVMEARNTGLPAKWTPSLGRDAAGRESTIEEAVRLGRLCEDHAARLLPHLGPPAETIRKLLESKG